MYPVIIFLVILLSTLLFLYKNVKKLVQGFIATQKIPGPPMHSIFFGNVKVLCSSREEIFKIMRQWALQYNSIYKLWMGVLCSSNIYCPEDVELVLSNSKHNTKSFLYNMLHGWLGSGLLTSKGKKWQTRRKILTPAFHFNILQKFIDIINENTDKLVDEIIEELRYKEIIIIQKHITQFTLKTIMETAMGTRFNFKTKKEQQYNQAIIDMGNILIYRLFRPWLLFRFPYLFNIFLRRKEEKLTKFLHKFTTEVIRKRKENFKGIDLNLSQDHDVYSGKKRLAMLDLLLSAQEKDACIDDEGIREEVDTFMFEGHDTTSTALGFSVMLIANHKKIQEQLYHEIEEILGPDLNKKPNYHDLQELSLLERCIKESLRLYPSVHFISRELGEVVISHQGYVLAKGTMAHVQIYDLHHNPEIYPDPEKFDPDRFLPENIQYRHPFAYIPFSAGPRNCIGQKFAMLELKSAICGILRNFVLEPVDTPETLVLEVDLMLRAKGGIKVKFIPRF